MLEKFFALTDDALAEKFNEKAVDPAKARKPYITMLNRRLKSLADGKKQKGDLTVKNDIAEFTLPFAINGESTVYIPAERAAVAITVLRDSIVAGDLDAEIAAANATGTTEKPKRTRRTKAMIEAEKAAREAAGQ